MLALPLQLRRIRPLRQQVLEIPVLPTQPGEDIIDDMFFTRFFVIGSWEPIGCMALLFLSRILPAR